MKAPEGLAEGTEHGFDTERAGGQNITHTAWHAKSGLGLVLGALIVIAVCTPLCVALNIWTDEGFTLHTTGAGARYALSQAIYFEAQPPAYFCIEALWRSLNETSIAFARIPSVFFVSLGVGVIVYAARRNAPRVPSLAIAVAVAFNPLVIWSGAELRAYPLVFLIGAVLAFTFREGFLAERPARSVQFLYAIVAIVGMYTQYYVGFLLMAQALTLLLVRRESLRPFLLCAAIIAILFAPYIPSAIMHIRSSSEFVSPTTFAGALHEVFDAVFVVVFPHDVAWSGSIKLAGLALSSLLAFSVVVVGRPEIPRARDLAFMLQWGICLAIFTVLFAKDGVPLVSSKHLMIVIPSTMLVAITFLSSIRPSRRVMMVIFGVSYMLFAGTTLWLEYRPPLEKPGDWQRLAQVVSADDKLTPISVFPAELTVPLGWYLKEPMIAVPAPMPYTLDYTQRMSLSNVTDVSRVLDPVQAKWARLWVVTTGDCANADSDRTNYHCHFFEQYLHGRYELVRSVKFNGSLARLFIRSSVISPILNTKTYAN